MKKQILTLLLAAALLLSLSSAAFAATSFYTVTFYTNSEKTTVFDTQQVARRGHPKEPASTPDAYEKDGFRYVFDQWYWTVDNNGIPFSFTDDNCRIFSDAKIYAGYAKYIAPGYQLIVNHSGGSTFVTDTTTPVTEIMASFTGVTGVSLQSLSVYEHGTTGNNAASAFEYGAEKSFATLADAISHADAGTTVTLLADTALDGSLTVRKNLTINLAGCKLTADSGASLVIDAAVTLDASAANSKFAAPVTVGSGASLTILGGDFTGASFTVQDGGALTVTGGSFSADPGAYVDKTAFEVTESAGVFTVVPHVHSYDYTAPVWSWQVQDGSTVAAAVYSCACGRTETVTVQPLFSDFKGQRTYRALDTHGNADTMTKTLTYKVSFDGTKYDRIYHWGDVCTLTADSLRGWYFGSTNAENRVADGIQTYSFAVTEDSDIVTTPTESATQQPVVRAVMDSNASGEAVFNVKWSVPAGSEILSVWIYRGFSMVNKVVNAETLRQKGTPFNANLKARNGDYTLHMTDLTPGSWQYAVLVVRYSLNGVTQEPLVSPVQKCLIIG